MNVEILDEPSFEFIQKLKGMGVGFLNMYKESGMEYQGFVRLMFVLHLFVQVSEVSKKQLTLSQK